jgi:hypothetical protein
VFSFVTKFTVGPMIIQIALLRFLSFYWRYNPVWVLTTPRFRNSKDFCGRAEVPLSKPNLEDQDYTSSGPSRSTCLEWMALPEAYITTSIA